MNEIKSALLNIINSQENLSIKQSMLFITISFLIKDIFFKKEILNQFEKFPSVYPNIVSFSENPNCSCKNKVFDFIKENYDACYEILNNILYLDNSIIDETIFKSIIDNLNSFLTKNEDKKALKLDDQFSKYLEGKVMVINDDRLEYERLIKSLRNSGVFYKGLSIVKKDAYLHIYFY
jgi:hypothetical protein